MAGGSFQLPRSAPSEVVPPNDPAYLGFFFGDGTEGTTDGLFYSIDSEGGFVLLGGPTFTDEDAQDAVGEILVDSDTIDFTYSDATPSITASVKDGSITAAKVASDVATQAELDAHTGDTSDAHAASAISVTPFAAISATDVQAALEEIAAESGATPTAAGTIFTPYGSIAASNVQAAIQEIIDEGGGGYDNEQAQDAIGAILTDSATIDLTYTDATPEITASVKDNSITNAKLADVATATIKGRITAGSGDPEDLTGAQALTVIGGAPLASPTFTGTPAAPTAAAGTDSTQLATTAYVDRGIQANSQTGTTYTLVLTDQNKVIECTNADSISVVVPPNSSVPFPVGTVVEVYQGGAGQVQVGPGSGVTVRAYDGAKTVGQYGSVTLRKRATDEWVCSGGVA